MPKRMEIMPIRISNNRFLADNALFLYETQNKISPANPAVITSMVNHTLQRSCVAHYVYETCEDIWDFKWRMECHVILWPV